MADNIKPMMRVAPSRLWLAKQWFVAFLTGRVRCFACRRTLHVAEWLRYSSDYRGERYLCNRCWMKGSRL